MQPADMLLVRGDGWVDHEIEDITHSPYSHVAGFVGFHRLVEAQAWRRIGYQSPLKYTGESAIYTCNCLTDEQRDGIVKYVLKEIGGVYDYPLIFVEWIRYVFHILLPYKEPFNWRDCSTLWSDAYRSVGVDLCPGIRYPSPGDLAESKLLRKVCNY